MALGWLDKEEAGRHSLERVAEIPPLQAILHSEKSARPQAATYPFLCCIFCLRMASFMILYWHSFDLEG